jgi:hypothetical protein
MTKRKTQPAEKEDKMEHSMKTDPWSGDIRLQKPSFFGGPPFTKDELRTLLIDLNKLLNEVYKKEKLSSRRRDLIRLHKDLKEFIDIQLQEFINVGQPRMLNFAVERLSKLDLKVEQLLKEMTRFQASPNEEEEFRDSEIIDMVGQSLNQPLACIMLAV